MNKNISILTIMLIISISAFAQDKNRIKLNWYNLDLKSDSVFGISIDKAFTKLLAKRKGKKVIVAVVDGGLDIKHEDLKNVIWTNPGEIPDNGKDDDRNGYVDDLHGWNFLGSSSESFEFGNDLLVLQIRQYKAMFEGKDTSSLIGKELTNFKIFKTKEKALSEKLKELNREIESTRQLLRDLQMVMDKIGVESPHLIDFERFTPGNNVEAGIRQFIITVLKHNPDLNSYVGSAKDGLDKKENDVRYRLNINYNPRMSYPYSKDRFYGNNNIYGPVAPAHGTHVAGVIAAERNNAVGINGVADHVELMTVRAIPDGHATGRDQANAIRYAADNGARVLNLSFGLGIETDGQMVRDALNYACSKDILIIQAAGNSHTDLDSLPGFPDRQSDVDQKIVKVFLKVGASGLTEKQLIVPFSNYGKKSVDVFAPGFEIKSTVPGNSYQAHSGTSMAAPVVTGLAAVIRSYYPKLTAQQVKEIIVKSVVKRDSLKNLCISGGIVNAYEAIRLASQY